ncbi:MAG: D-alanyl-D-alanine carboxypeptidase [Rhizobiales bacterium]|nr:D-alanyl-D-alanine carboxypeptidase [Hyphomicrobiales bacterium]
MMLLVPGTARAQEVTFKTDARYAILIDSRSGKIFFEKDSNELMAPASMSKIMTMLMVFERLRDKRMKLSDEFTISENAWRRGGASSGGSTMYAELNSRVKLEDLMRGVIVQSANDACIAIAEGIAGSEEAFSGLMTKRARELGLVKSTFKNATGLPDPEHRMTAFELATLARYLIEVFPEYYKLYSEREFTWNKIRQFNRNPLLANYPGADGIKTGFIREAGYGLVGSAVRAGRRLIVVVNGLGSKSARGREAQKLLDWGFRKFQQISLFERDAQVSQARVWGGNKSWVSLVAKEPVNMLLAPEERATARAEIVYKGPLRAPVRKGQQVGFIRLSVDGKTVSQQPLYTGGDIEVSNEMWRQALDSVTFMLFGG